ncbi:DUF4360 domain-containing protein [Nannocystis punicea]|uniref:DUF4360 domain-containing protein n=1 Tax=Nannocystis punicea TaxID=2995304 RepID=A0ABY7GYN4_9BACT|nr:DUF4360 domain-containing protein [Nannocystis poenicansa]WAS92099.1 DUF4360 domain-containing protein [Nannocystis poenicansa]
MLILSTFTELQATLLGLLASFAAPARDEPLDLAIPPTVTASSLDEVYIEELDAFGPGCPPGTFDYTIAEDRKSFILGFYDLRLENPSPDGKKVQYTNCLATVKLHIPEGLQVSVSTVNSRGYAFLDPGIRGRQTSKYFFAGEPTSVKAHTELSGPYDDDYDFTDEVPFLTWSECGEQVIYVVDSSLQLNATGNPGGTALFNLNNIDGRFEMVFHLTWQEC